MSKPIKILVYVVLAFVLLFFAWYIFFNYAANKGILVKWQGRWYTQGQLKKVLPPQVYSVEAKNTPEEAYAKFREALLADDLEGALGQMTEESRGKYAEAFKDEVKLKEWVKRLPENIVKESEDNNHASYDVDMGTENRNTALFIKSRQGYWQIDAL